MGFTEHGGRYAELAARLNQHGYSVRAMDLRGHGRSGGDRAFVRSFDQYVDKTLKLYEGLYHDLFHEPEREQVTADLITWLDARR